MPPLEADCPTCGTRITWASTYPFRPFCSERCKLIDLGQWANEQYRVAGEPAEPDENTSPRP